MIIETVSLRCHGLILRSLLSDDRDDILFAQREQLIAADLDRLPVIFAEAFGSWPGRCATARSFPGKRAGDVSQIIPGIDTLRVPIAEHDPHAVAHRLYVENCNGRLVSRRRVRMRHAAACRAWTPLPERRVVDPLRLAVMPRQGQSPCRGVNRYVIGRVHRCVFSICANAMRAALRTSGSGSAAAACKAGTDAVSPSSPSDKAASLRKLLIACVSSTAMAAPVVASRSLPNARTA